VGYQLSLDGGASLPGASTSFFLRDLGIANSALTFVFTGLSAGPHTVTVQWMDYFSTGSESINPTAGSGQHASLLVEDVP
jgi:hypothetical protein